MAIQGALAGRTGGLRLKLVLLVLSSIAAFLVAEVTLHVVVPLEFLVSRGIDDRSWQYMWLAQRERNATTEQLTALNPLMTFSPTLGWRPRPYAQRDNLRLNSRGLRTSREYSLDKGPGERRIVVIGDSFTFADRYLAGLQRAIPEDQTYPALVERGLSRTTAINMGVPGYGTDQMYLYMQEEGWRYQPDIVVLTLFVDNLNRSLLGFRDYAKPRFDLVDDTLRLRNVPLQPPEVMERTLSTRPPRIYSWFIARSVMLQVASQLAPVGWLRVDRLNMAILDAFLRECRHHRVFFLVVMIPEPELMKGRRHRSERIVQKWATRAHVPVVALRDEVAKLPQSQRASLYGHHLTPFGHRVLSTAVLAALRRHASVDRNMSEIAPSLDALSK